MNRPSADSDGFGHDSFLDIVANIVGILIILVLVAGLRARNASATVEPTPAKPRPELVALAQARRQMTTITSDIHSLHAQAEEVAGEMTARRGESQFVATRVARFNRELAERRGKLDAAQRERFDLSRQVSTAGAALSRLEHQRRLAEGAGDRSIEIESLPTPISKTVDGNEAHFRLLGGRIAHVPLDKMLEQLKDALAQNAYKLKKQQFYTGTLGPLQGFYLRYTFERVDLAGDGRIGSLVQLAGFQLVPTSAKLGETLDEAFHDGSEFRAVIAKIDARNTTVTLWTYPDSFAEFRRLKKELFRRGFDTAGRPMPHGVQIGGSPTGTRSSAQ